MDEPPGLFKRFFAKRKLSSNVGSLFQSVSNFGDNAESSGGIDDDEIRGRGEVARRRKMSKSCQILEDFIEKCISDFESWFDQMTEQIKKLEFEFQSDCLQITLLKLQFLNAQFQNKSFEIIQLKDKINWLVLSETIDKKFNHRIKVIEDKFEKMRYNFVKDGEQLRLAFSDCSEYLQSSNDGEKRIFQLSLRMLTAVVSTINSNEPLTEETKIIVNGLCQEVCSFPSVIEKITEDGNQKIEKYESLHPLIRPKIEQKLTELKYHGILLEHASDGTQKHFFKITSVYQPLADIVDDIFANLSEMISYASGEIPLPDDPKEMKVVAETLQFHQEKIFAGKKKLVNAVCVSNAAISSICLVRHKKKKIENNLILQYSLPQELNYKIDEISYIIRLMNNSKGSIENYLSSATKMIAEYENQEKIKSSITEWLEQHTVMVKEFRKKPLKLDMTVNQLEISKIEDLLPALELKRADLIRMNLQSETQIFRRLNLLRQEITRALRDKSNALEILVDYLVAVLVVENYFKKFEKSINSIKVTGQKEKIFLKNIFKNFQETSVPKVAAVMSRRVKIHHLVFFPQLEEKETELRLQYEKIKGKLREKYKLIEMIILQMNAVVKKMDETRCWLKEKYENYCFTRPLSANIDKLDQLMEKLTQISVDCAKYEKDFIEEISGIIDFVEPELDSAKFSLLSKNFSSIKSQFQEVRDVVSSSMSRLITVRERLIKFLRGIQSFQIFFRKLMNEIEGVYRFEPLQSADVEKSMQILKNYKNEIVMLKSRELHLLREEFSLLKRDCDAEDAETLDFTLRSNP